MKCPSCAVTMRPAGSVVSTDQKTIVTTYLCPQCYGRKPEVTPNPRYVPVAKVDQASLADENRRDRRRRYVIPLSQKPDMTDAA